MLNCLRYLSIFFMLNTAFAGTMGSGPCAIGNVTIPCAQVAWDIGVDALYLWPNYTQEYSFLGTRTPVVTHSIPLEYYAKGGHLLNSWGFLLEGSYHFSTGTDVNVNWHHIAPRTSKVFNTGPYLSPLPIVSTPVSLPSSIGFASLQPKWDAVNVEMGQKALFGARSKLRFHGGMQWASISTFYQRTATDVHRFIPDQLLPFVGYTSKKSLFDGLGPRLGLDTSYTGWWGFSIYANAAGAILAGHNNLQAIFLSTSHPHLRSVYETAKHWAVVPEVEGRIGFKYTCMLGQGDFVFDLGWMWVNYFSAQLTNILDETLMPTSFSDFALQGPYWGVKWVGNVA